MTTDTREASWNPVPGTPVAGQHPYVLPDGRIGGYTDADFPAPAGVGPLGDHRPVVADKPRRRAGVLLAAASLSAVLGAGAGIGSYAYLSSG